MFSVEYGLKIIYHLVTESHKRALLYNGLWGKTIRNIFYYARITKGFLQNINRFIFRAMQRTAHIAVYGMGFLKACFQLCCVLFPELNIILICLKICK